MGIIERESVPKEARYVAQLRAHTVRMYLTLPEECVENL